MTWLQRIALQLRSSLLGPLTANSPELARLSAGPPSSTGLPVTQENALTYSAVWAAVSLISANVGSLPLILYKRLRDGGKERYTDHPLYRVLHAEPNPEMTSFLFRETLQAHLLTWGNAYAEIERDSANRVVALWPLTPDRVAPARDAAGRAFYRVAQPSGGEVKISAANMLHIPGLANQGNGLAKAIALSHIAVARGGQHC